MIEYIGRYQITETLGRGGMGVVYKAIDPNLERIVAIKCLNDELAGDELVVARFLREARNVAALSHPNCVRLYLADEQDGKPYLVMEYVDGETLADRISKHGALSADEATRIVRDCAQALAAADEKNIVHRDVKPGNIMLDRSGRALLTDFGIAQVQYSLAEKGSDTILGTPGYMPPELVRDGKSDRRGDIFALGAVYYEMLTGKRLIEGHDLSASTREFARDDFPELGALPDSVDPAVRDRLNRMLALDAADRYPDYQALLADFAPEQASRDERARETAPTAVMKRGRDTEQSAATMSITQAGGARSSDTKTVPLDDGARMRRFGIMAAVVAGIAVIGLAIALTTSETDQPSTPSVADAPATEEAHNAESPARPAASTAAADVEQQPGNSASGPAQPTTSAASSAPQVSATALLRQMRADRDEQGEQPRAEAGESPRADTRLALNDSATSSPAAVAETSATATPRRSASAPGVANPSAASASKPRGISVVGVGDPAITEPMVSEIEQRLRADGLPVVERRFIAGFDQYLLADGLDLAGLREPAADAGVGYIVMARARPTGERELHFYGNYTTAYGVQIDAITWDLARGSQLGSSAVKQLEYTSINAAQQGRNTVQAWLDPIADQFHR